LTTPPPGAHATYAYKDVQVDPAKRNQMMQTWGREEQDSLTKRWTRRSTKRMNLQEGLGIDHEQWLRERIKTNKPLWRIVVPVVKHK